MYGVAFKVSVFYLLLSWSFIVNFDDDDDVMMFYCNHRTYFSVTETT